MEHSKYLLGHAAVILSELDSIILYQLWVHIRNSEISSNRDMELSAACLFFRLRLILVPYL